MAKFRLGTSGKVGLRALSISLLAGLLFGFGGYAAYAVTTITPVTTIGTVAGTCYRGQMSLTKITGANPVGAMLTTARVSGCATAKTVPTGYIYAFAMTERYGTLCAIGERYSTEPATSLAKGVAKNCGTGTYRARGRGAGFNPGTSSYHSGWTGYTPSIVVN